MTVYAPVVVPPEGGGVPPLLLLPLPQPMPAPAMRAKKSATERIRSALTARSERLPRRVTGTPKKRSASVTPPPTAKMPFNGMSSLVVCAVVLIVKVDVKVAPARVTEAVDKEQVGGSLAPAGLAVTEHVRATLPA